MCGIAGVASMRGELDASITSTVRRMAETLRHRGPDGDGIFSSPQAVLASRRLAIVDLQGGAQPVFDESGNVCTVFNGEILNHEEIRVWLQSRGHVFRSRCDSEVLVHLYEEESERMVDRLEGQFAFALWDARRARLLLARDRFGICPLHYACVNNQIVFASEIKAILATGLVPISLDEGGLAEVVCMGFTIAPRTMFRSISSLPPAHTLTLKEGNLSICRYWDLHFPREGEHELKPLRFYVDGVVGHVERAVRRTMAADVPVGTFLSGGIDSAIVTAVAARLRRTALPAFSVGSSYRSLDESGDARRVAAFVGAPLETISGDDDLIGRRLPELVEHAESPVQTTEAVALMALADRAGESVRVVLTGEGADEAFGGYAVFRQHQILGPVNRSGGRWGRSLARFALRARYGTDYLVPQERERAKIVAAIGCLPAQAYAYQSHRALAPLVFSGDHIRKILDYPCWEALRINHDVVANRHPLNQSLYVGYRAMLSNYLLGPHGDRALMAHSVEGRYPFLDRELVEFAAAIPPKFKLRAGTEKFVLRRAAEAWFPARIPAPRKRAFTTPYGTPFIREDAPELIRNLLLPETLADFGYFDQAAVSRLIGIMRANPIPTGEMALAFNLVVSTQLFHFLFLGKGKGEWARSG